MTSGTVTGGNALNDPIASLGAIGVIPVIVIDDAARAAPLAETLLGAGLAAAEVTLRSPAAMAALEIMASVPGLLVGAGTVLDPVQAQRAADGGARFAVSPGFDPDVVHACRARSLPVLPGAVTATEVQRVRRAGITVCKFFPAEAAGGVRALIALAAPFPDMRFVPTGGIGPDNIARYLVVPSVHAVAGSWMVPRELIAAGRWDLIRAMAAEAAVIASARPAAP